MIYVFETFALFQLWVALGFAHGSKHTILVGLQSVIIHIRNVLSIG